MEIDKLTLGEIKQISALLGNNSNHPYKIGASYLIRTVTMIQTGRLVEVTNQELVLEDAAWIANTSRYRDYISKSIVTGEFPEVEPFPEGRVIVGRGAVIDAFDLPRSMK